MSILLRLLAIYMLGMALVVAANFVLTPLYHTGGDSFPVWECLNWFMAVAVVIALLASICTKRSLGADTDVKRHINVNTLFYASLLLFLWFFANWFGNLTGRENYWSELWWFIDVLFPIVVGVAGMRMLCAAGSSGRT